MINIMFHDIDIKIEQDPTLKKLWFLRARTHRSRGAREIISPIIFKPWVQAHDQAVKLKYK